MPRTRLALALATLLSLSAPALAHDQHQDIDKINGSITAETGQTYGDVETVNGSIRIEDNARVGEAETVNGSIHAEDNIRARSLTTVNGGIRIGTQAQIEDGIETVNGAIGLVDTDLGGGIETVNGDITVGVGSHVKGGIHVEKPGQQWFSMGKRKPPRIVIGPNAQVDGALVFEREVKLYVHRSAKIGAISGATAVRYDGDRAPED